MRLADHADALPNTNSGSHLTINEALALLSPAKDLRRGHLTGQVEWYTPSPYLDCARQVLENFDLDPASSEIAQEQVRAVSYFTKDDDGLLQEWSGKVWCNPPYCDADKFVDKLLAELAAGLVTEALLLVNAYSDTKWFHRAAAACAAIFFTLGRIRFMTPDGEAQGQPPHGSAIFYFGPRLDRFCDAFAAHGVIIPRAGRPAMIRCRQVPLPEQNETAPGEDGLGSGGRRSNDGSMVDEARKVLLRNTRAHKPHHPTGADAGPAPGQTEHEKGPTVRRELTGRQQAGYPPFGWRSDLQSRSRPGSERPTGRQRPEG